MIRPFLAAIALAILCSHPAAAQRASEGNMAVLRWLDRTTGDLSNIEMPVGRTHEMKSLAITLRGCRYPRGSINSEAYGLLDIEDMTTNQRIFSGWMVASSPGLNALEHPRYDVWVIRCKVE